MKRNGNTNSNRTYNPRNTKPSIPLDVDEVDAALERFIRQKYDQQLFSGGGNATRRHNTGSTRSSDDLPPPLPPKPTKRFGFGLRSASSTTTTSKSAQDSPSISPEAPDRRRSPPSPMRVNKQSRVFGASVGSSGENLDSKLSTLRDMGFPDEKRNLNVLKGLGGNLERTVESLVRLGEGSTLDSRTRAPTQYSNISPSQPSVSKSDRSNSVVTTTPGTNGSIQTELISQAGSSNPSGTNAPSNQTAQNLRSSNPFQPQSLNPFGTVPETQRVVPPLEKVFNDMQISQPLFPHATGGYPTQHQQAQESRLLQSMTPPVFQPPYQQFQTNPYSQPSYISNGHHNPFSSALHASSTPSTPYLGSPLVLNSAFNPYTNLMPTADLRTGGPVTNGYASRGSEGYVAPLQQQQQQQMYIPGPQLLSSSNPYITQQQSSIGSSPLASPQYPNTEPLPFQYIQPQRTGRIDKSSILALYNYPQMAPLPLPGSNESKSINPISFNPPSSQPSSTPAEDAPTQVAQAQRSVTMPLLFPSGSRNPFHLSSTNPSPLTRSPLAREASLSRHVSQDSMDIGGVQNGRHSPDAFASLSARVVR